MIRRPIQTTLLALLFVAAACQSVPAGSESSRLSHDVYFTLQDSSEHACEELMESCRELADLPGVELLRVGLRAEEFDREPNDTEFHVALHVLFRDRQAYDGYLIAPRHVALVERFGGNFAGVQVFDWWER